MLLQGFDLRHLPADCVDSFRSGERRRDRRDVRDLVPDGGLANIRIIRLARLALGRVDQKLDIAVHDIIGDMWALLAHLVGSLGLDLVLGKELLRPFCRLDLET